MLKSDEIFFSCSISFCVTMCIKISNLLLKHSTASELGHQSKLIECCLASHPPDTDIISWLKVRITCLVTPF